MENINEGCEQKPLFGCSQESSLFYVTNQRNLMSFLGSGMLMPAEGQFRYKEDSREFFGGAIPFWKGGLPSSKRYEGSLQSDRLVVIECHEDDVMKYGGRFVVYDDESVVAVNSPVPLLCVRSIYLSSEDGIEDFLIRLPEDVIADRSIFKVLSGLSSIHCRDDVNIEKVESISNWLSFVDSFGAGVKSLELFSSEGVIENSYILDLIPLCLESFGLVVIDTKLKKKSEGLCKISEPDRQIFIELLSLLQGVKPEDGFDQIYILDRLEERLLLNTIGISEDVRTWLDYVRKVIEAEKEVPVLADEGDIIKRAILLFLLRFDLDRLKASVESSISPGPVVLSVAALLSGYTVGLTRMGPEYKGSYREYNRFTKSLLDSLWSKSSVIFDVIREPTPSSGQTQLYQFNDEILFKLDVAQNVILARVLNQAKSAGFDLQYDYENQELKYQFDFGDGRSQTVYIELVKPLGPGFDVVRFVSPCLDLSGKKIRALKKDVAVDLLKRNSESSMYCAFSFSQRRKAIVAEAMQIVKTMDDNEFVTLLKYVAKVADNYERDVLGLDTC